ncbi:MAG TPA: 16S rRNA (guanine(966)-N(2))-methyltransferase RsmD [Bryobacteraceae bacterium]|jgi:16S rRNA (guanine(966)-N(2))-methyltransferase RsmD|nr:16S rRNA (guanine(966)-N(2))-methyltransferase RsmD [Bryobacteraceae bacterium]
MRVIGGRFRSRRLKSIPGLGVRPTPDRLREALFNVLAPRIEGTRFLDAYAGTGAVGIEALSRGAKHVTLIESHRQALEAIRENVTALQIGKDEITVVRGSAAVLLGNYPADIAFVDPPYDQEKQYGESLVALSNARCPLVIAQHASRLALEDRYGELVKARVLRQGDNSLSFYELEDVETRHSRLESPLH